MNEGGRRAGRRTHGTRTRIPAAAAQHTIARTPTYTALHVTLERLARPLPLLSSAQGRKVKLVTVVNERLHGSLPASASTAGRTLEAEEKERLNAGELGGDGVRSIPPWGGEWGSGKRGDRRAGREGGAGGVTGGVGLTLFSNLCGRTTRHHHTTTFIP